MTVLNATFEESVTSLLLQIRRYEAEPDACIQEQQKEAEESPE
jgi:hypothetical protein